MEVIPAHNLVGATERQARAQLPRALETLTVGGVPTARITRRELADLMVLDTERARAGELAFPKIVIASNGASIAAYHRNPLFRDILDRADIVDADGMPLVIASRMFCTAPLKERVATTDFIHDAAMAAVPNGIRFYFLGSVDGIAEKAAANLRACYPGLEIVGVRQGYFTMDEEEAICEDIRTQKTDVLWVGLGTPQQEGFAMRNRANLVGLAWIRTCGGMFDHCSGRFPRAPNWMQDLGLEWMFRALLEPSRLGRRYLMTNPSALYHLATKTHD